jgi:hypothetical protein
MDTPGVKTGRSAIFTVADQIARVDVQRPHVVIIGSGASAAAFPNGDRNGKRLPTMPDFVSTLGLDSVLRNNGVPPPYVDFEGIYSQLVSNPQTRHVAAIVEQVIDGYFSDLELPDAPSLYDHLILSLRPKDVIASFNWDPFLSQACQRNSHFAKPPQILFLHGNTDVGFCLHHRQKGPRMNGCSVCGEPYESCRLLYPVARKNYTDDAFISAEWDGLKMFLRQAFALTIFGFGAPKTDVEAVDLLHLAWGKPEDRRFEEVEIIDKKTEPEVVQTWSGFIHTHHYQTQTSFYNSLMARHPRRTCEHLWARLMEARWPQRVEFPREASFEELYRWLAPRLEVELRP